MEALIQTISAEIPDMVTHTVLIEFVPRLIQESQKLAIPGADKKAIVIKALHALVDERADKDIAADFHLVIDNVVSTTVDMLIDVSKGRIIFSAPQTVEEVTQKVNCFLQFAQFVLTLVSKAKKAIATSASETTVDTTKTETAVDTTKTETAVDTTKTENTEAVADAGVIAEIVAKAQSDQI